MQAFIRAVNSTSQVVGILAAGMIVVAVAITCQMIFIRYFLNGSTVWQTEAVIYLMIAATLLGLPYVQKLKGHVNVDLVPMLLPPAARKLLLITSFLAAIAILTVMAYHGAELVHLSLFHADGSLRPSGPPALDSLFIDAFGVWLICSSATGGSARDTLNTCGRDYC